MSIKVFRCAIFPIPNVVLLPGQNLPLHIFEQRYRLMLRECFAEGHHLGIAFPKNNYGADVLENEMETLKKKTEIYEPSEILSCGIPKMRDELSDGRMLIQVFGEYKVKIEKILQEVPFILADVRAVEQYNHQDTIQEREKLIEVIKDYFQETKTANVSELDSELRKLNLPDIIGDVFSLFRFSAGFKQELLEANSWKSRVSKITTRLKAEMADNKSNQNYGEVIQIDEVSKKKK